MLQQDAVDPGASIMHSYTTRRAAAVCISCVTSSASAAHLPVHPGSAYITDHITSPFPHHARNPACPPQLPALPSASPSKTSSSSHGHGHSSSRATSAPSVLHGSSGLISSVHWAWQADALLAEVSSSTSRSASSASSSGRQQVKSLALLAELRLAEALEKAGRVAPVQLDEDGLPLPHKLRTAVCCQVGPLALRLALLLTA
jgi:hypothetical protein